MMGSTRPLPVSKHGPVAGRERGSREHTALRRYLLQKILRYLFIAPREWLDEIYAVVRRRLLDIKPLEPKRHV